MTATIGITLSIAILGAVLGLLNTWKAYDRDKVKLRVVTKMSYPFGMPDNRPSLCIEIVNLSLFPVTISQVGFLLNQSKKRLSLIDPIMHDGGKFPRRLEARSSFTVYFEPGVENSANFKNAKSAYAETDCGELFKGSGNELIKFQ